MTTDAHRVVLVGGGFGGLHAARRLGRAPVEVTLVDRRNFHLFQPLLYQVATGGLSPANIAAPLRAVLGRHENTRVLLAEAEDVDAGARRLLLADGASVPYDTLVVAAGSSQHYFGHPEWESLAPGLKTLEDATEIRRRVLLAFERAERSPDPAERAAQLSFVVAGGGPTGVELSGALAEIARRTLRSDFRRIDPAGARITLVEGGDRVLAGMPASLGARAEESLRRLGVEVRTGALVDGIEPGRVRLRAGDQSETLAAATALWAAGVRASPFGERLAEAAGVETDDSGRLAVGPDLSLPGHPEILVVGDLARFEHGRDAPLPGVAAVAMQQGRHAARVIEERLKGRKAPDFRYRDRGQMATIGRAAAVAEVGPLRFGGYAAWLAWLAVHLLYLVQFENRLLVGTQWAWNYTTWNRSARLITGAWRE